jgi:hypothetical protein
MAKIRIDPEKTYTKSAFHKKTGMSRSTIDRKIEGKEIKTVEIKGTILIIEK